MYQEELDEEVETGFGRDEDVEHLLGGVGFASLGAGGLLGQIASSLGSSQ